MSFSESHREKDKQADADILAKQTAEWDAVKDSYRERALRAARDPVAKAALNFDIASRFPLVKEAKAAISSPLKEIPPSEGRLEKTADFKKLAWLRENFEKRIKPVILAEPHINTINSAIEMYDKADTQSKSDIRRAIQDQIINGFVKGEDPSSVVMIGEFARLMKGQGTWGSQFLAKLMAGGIEGGLPIDDNHLRALVKVANNAFKAQTMAIKPNYDRYRSNIKTYAPEEMDTELEPYKKYFEGTETPVASSRSYTQSNPLTVKNPSELPPKGSGTWIRYKNPAGKFVVEQY
jgi:hypothetical protein